MVPLFLPPQTHRGVYVLAYSISSNLWGDLWGRDSIAPGGRRGRGEDQQVIRERGKRKRGHTSPTLIPSVYKERAIHQPVLGRLDSPRRVYSGNNRMFDEFLLWIHLYQISSFFSSSHFGSDCLGPRSSPSDPRSKTSKLLPPSDFLRIEGCKDKGNQS